MNKITFITFAAAFCLVLLQIEIIFLFSLQGSNLRTWDSQVNLNQSLIDTMTVCAKQ